MSSYVRARRGASRPRLIAGTAIVAVLLLACWLWIGTLQSDLRFEPRIDPFNETAQAFLHGRTWLDLPIPSGLASLRDPYDPAARAPFVDGTITDLSYFHGRLYAYWGPVPALLFALPAQAVGLDSFPPLLAMVLMLAGGLACAAALLRGIVVRYAPQTPPSMQLAALATLGLSGMAPYLLQSSRAYEIAIAGGYCFTWAGLLAVAHAVWRPARAVRLLAVASACFGLAFGSRPNMLLAAVALLIAGVWLWRARGCPPWRLAAAASAPLLACLIAFALYNRARFGSFGDFGYRYLLAGLDQYHKPLGRLAFMPPGLWYYFVAPIRWRLTFPFAYLPPPPLYPGPIPHGWGQVDLTGGLLTTTPMLWMLGGLPFAWRRLRPELRWAAGGAAALGLAIAASLALFLFGVAQRYEADFVTMLLIAALVLWFWAYARAPRRRRRTIRVLGILAVAYGGYVVTATALTAGDLEHRRPGVWRALQGFFGPVATLHAEITGRPHVIAAAGRPAEIDRLTMDGAEFLLGRDGAVVKIASPIAGPAELIAKVEPLQPWTFRSQLAIHVTTSPARSSATVPFPQPRTGAVPITLAHGINTVRFSATGDPPLRHLDTDPDANQILHVLSLDVRAR
jgi:hypothetical protein